MRILDILAGALVAGSALAVPPVPNSARGRDLSFTDIDTPALDLPIPVNEDNTLNGTGRFQAEEILFPLLEQDSTIASLPLVLVNNMKTGNPIYAYISGIDTSGRVCFLRADGSFLYPSSGGSPTPVPIDSSIGILINPPGEEPLRILVPTALSSARVYLSEGEQLQFYVVSSPIGDGIVQPSVANPDDPNLSKHWGFMEFTLNPDGSLFANLSFVDFVGLILSISLQDRQTNATSITRALGPNAVRDMCNGLTQQAAEDKQPWNKLCISHKGKLVRVLSPEIYQSIHGDAFAGYFDSYVERVWQRYSSPSSPLRVDTQRADVGVSNCTTEGDQMVCSGAEDWPFDKPNARNIWGCDSGPFGRSSEGSSAHRAIVPRLCAAFVRSTLLLPGGEMQPGPKPDEYYLGSPANHYSRLVHSLEIDDKGYAFSFDDVNPYGVHDASGAIASSGARQLTVYVGGSG